MTTLSKPQPPTPPLLITKVYHKGTLQLPNPATFSGTQPLVEGLFSWLFAGKFESGLNEDAGDAYFYVRFPHTHLARTDATLLENSSMPMKDQNFIVIQCLRYNSKEDVQAKIQLSIQNFLKHHSVLPKKLIMPIGGCIHTACLVIEPHGNDFHVTCLDSLSCSTDYGLKEAATGIKLALETLFRSSKVDIVGNTWSQNNLMKCGVHVLKNIQFVTGYSGSLFDLVSCINTGTPPPPECAPRTEEGLIQAIQEMRAEVFPLIKKVYEMNPGQLFMETSQGTLPIKF